MILGFVDMLLQHVDGVNMTGPVFDAERPFNQLPKRAPKICSRELVELIFEQPHGRIANVVAGGIAKRQTASEYLTHLAHIGVLTTVQSGREKLFIHRALLDLLASEAHELRPYGPRRRVSRTVRAS